MGTAAIFSVAVLAAEIAADLAVPASLVGAFVSLVYFSAQLSGLAAGGLIERHGAARISQFCMLCVVAGVALLLTGSLPLAILAAVVLGFNYGPLNPTSTVMLAPVSGPRWQALVFSLKQTGVPVAGIAAGAILPLIAVSFGWRWALVAVAGCALVVLAALEPLHRRARKDRSHADGSERHVTTRLGFFAPLRMVFTDPALRATSIVAFGFAGCQISVASFYVLYLTEAQGMTLVDAGLLFAVVQAGAVFGRIFWGGVAGPTVSSTVVLVVLGVVMGGSLAAVAAMTPDWPLAIIVALSFLLGLSSFGWNGVLLSDVANLAPRGRLGEATGGAQFVMFGGVAVLPTLVGLMISVTGGYVVPFTVTGGIAMAMGIYLLAARKRWRI